MWKPVKAHVRLLQKWQIRHPEHEYGSPAPLNDAWKFAERLVDDVFTADERSRWSAGDMVAAVYGPAREDVRNRIDGRTPR